MTRIKEHLKVLATDIGPRLTGTPGNKRARFMSLAFCENLVIKLSNNSLMLWTGKITVRH